MKTIEEIKASVLAECENLDGHLTYLPNPYERECIYASFHNEEWTVRIGGCSVVLPLDMDASCQEWFAAYRLLGLEARDAVDEKNKWESRAWKLLQIVKDKSVEEFAHMIRIIQLESDLQSERANTAALVEALDVIKDIAKWPESMDGYAHITDAVKAALAAHKKGGSDR